MARVLFADDDPAFRDALTLALQDAGHQVTAVPDGLAVLDRLDAVTPDVVISDVNMPRLDGFTLCRRLRERAPRLPILLLTARDTEIDEALGLELGADDYVTKPVSTRVVALRIAALLRRTTSIPTAVASDGLHVDADRLEIAWNGHGIEVTVTEFRLVEALVSRVGFVLNREQLMDRMRGDDSVVDPRIVDTYIRRLRRKFEEIDPAFDRIETRVGAGYRWRS
jgi:DNA-binding response OmpR family regulator